jgi:hypothetical protein
VLIDPFTVIAQIVNFAILAFALKRLLYDRVIQAMDAREASIAARLDDAARNCSPRPAARWTTSGVAGCGALLASSASCATICGGGRRPKWST